MGCSNDEACHNIEELLQKNKLEKVVFVCLMGKEDRSGRAAKIFQEWIMTPYEVYMLQGGFQTFFATYKTESDTYFAELDSKIWKVKQHIYRCSLVPK